MSIDSTYKTKHMKLNCSCDGFENSERVVSVLKGNGIPLIQAQKQKEAEAGPKKFQIIDSDPGIDFVAISHVWVEGLGNPHANSLPSCSLEWV
jgi:hypothetical protein